MSTAAKKAAPKKATVKKAAPKKAAPKKATAKKAAPKKATAKKATAKKAAPKKATAKKATVKSDAEKKNSKEIKSISNEIVPSSDTSKKKVIKTDVNKKAVKKSILPKKSTKKYVSTEINNKTIDSKKHEYVKLDVVKEDVDIVYELPERYNETKLTLMMRDPDWCYFYWDVSDEDTNKHEIQSKKLFVKIFRLSGVDITEHKQHTEIEVGKRYGDWYVNLNMPHTYFIAELGYYLSDAFVVLARSNIVYAPRDTISNIYDDEWMVNEEVLKLLYEPIALRESLSSATIFQLVDLQRSVGSSSLLQKRN